MQSIPLQHSIIVSNCCLFGSCPNYVKDKGNKPLGYIFQRISLLAKAMTLASLGGFVIVIASMIKEVTIDRLKP